VATDLHVDFIDDVFLHAQNQRQSRHPLAADYADFVFRFDYRLPSKTAGAALLLRANQGPDGKRREYAVMLDGAGDGVRLAADGMPLSERPAAPRTWTPTGWTPCEIRVERARLTVRIAGATVAAGELLDKPAGRIGFRVDRGGIELRRLRVAPIVRVPFHPDLSVGGGPGITAPTIKRHVAPVYPAEARRRGISGTVLLDIEILADGLIGDINVAASPHPEFIAPAIACVRKWRFNPARKDGVPVAVTAKAEVAFNLTR
jgi:protein TonB